ncbi:MAG: DUF1684 domain-containing protein [Acidimicrobiales bacterium]
MTALYARVRDLAEHDPAAAHAMWRADRDSLFAAHIDSPLPREQRRRCPGLRYAPYDDALRFEVDVDSGAPPERLEVPTATDGIVPLERIGRVELPRLGSLDVWWIAVYGGGVFVPMRDASAGRTTYGGGRYVIDTVKGADLGGEGGRLVIDLNFAYNPSCAYDPGWTCPLAPPGNVLGTEVNAGELAPPTDS